MCKHLCTTLLLLFSVSWGYAQSCPLNCNDRVNVSLDTNCQRILTPFDVMNGDTSCYSTLIVDIQYYNKSLGNQVGIDQVGKVLKFQVFDPNNNNNSCWGEILVSKKSKPRLMSSVDTIDCLDPLPSLSSMRDACDLSLTVKVISESSTNYSCNPSDPLVGEVTRSLRLSDPWNNSTTATQTIYLRRTALTGITCPTDQEFECCTPINGKSLWDEKYSIFDKQGYAHPVPIINDLGQSVGLVEPPYKLMGGQKMYIWELKGRCNLVVDYHDHVIEECGFSYTIRREWTIQDWCTREEWTCVQYIVVKDKKPPVFKDHTSYSGSQNDCNLQYVLEAPEITEECGYKGSQKSQRALDKIKVSYKVIKVNHSGYGNYHTIKQGEIQYGESIPVTLSPGDYHIKYEALDECGNYGYLLKEITVKDQSALIPKCVSQKSMAIDPNDCSGKIYAHSLDNGSHHTCCDRVHYAIALKDSVDYYKKYWEHYFEECYGYSRYQSYKVSINQVIDEWIDAFVFNDYVDLSGCGQQKVVFRVYDMCSVPDYSTSFLGNKHQWYSHTTTADYSCHFVANYMDIKQGDMPRPGMSCGQNGYGAPAIDYCSNFNASTYGYLQQQGASSSEIAQLKSMHKSSPATNSHLPTKDCMTTVYVEGGAAPTCYMDAAEKDMYCDGVLINPTDPQSIAIASCISGNEEVSYVSAIGENCSTINGSTNLWKPIYCTMWSALDNMSMPQDKSLLFDTPTVEGGCQSMEMKSTYSESLDDCGNGWMMMTYDMEDDCGHSSSCEQIIHVRGRSDFEVIFPADTVISCEAMIDQLGDVQFGDVDCEQLHISYQDEMEEVDGATILWRSWTVIDSCVYQEDKGLADVIVNDQQLAGDERPCVIRHLKDNGDGIMHYLQRIQMISSQELVMQCMRDTTICTGDQCSTEQMWLQLAWMENDCATSSSSVSYSYRILMNGDSSDVIRGDSAWAQLTLPMGMHIVEVDMIDGSDIINQCGFYIQVTSCNPSEWNCPDDLSVCALALSCQSPNLDTLIGEKVSNCSEQNAVTYQYIVKPYASEDKNEWVIYDGNHLQGSWPVGTHGLVLIANDDNSIDSCFSEFSVQACSEPQLSCTRDSFEFCISSMDCEMPLDFQLGQFQGLCSTADSANYFYIIKPRQSTDTASWVYGVGATLQEQLPEGTYEVDLVGMWEGQIDTCTSFIEVFDCREPELTCIDSMYVFTISDSIGLTIYANELGVSGIDNCQDPMLMTYTFEWDSMMTELHFSCEDLIPLVRDTIDLTVWVGDGAGNFSACDRQVIVIAEDCVDDLQIMNKSAMDRKMLIDERGKQLTSFIGSDVSIDIVQSINQSLVFPNPFTHSTTIEKTFSSKVDMAKLTIYTQSGQVVHQSAQSLSSNKAIWTVDGRLLGDQTGMYFFQITSSRETEFGKLILTR